MNRRWGSLAALVALAGITADAAHAAPGFSPGRPIGNGSAPVTAIADDGQVFVAWVAPGGESVFTSRRAATDKTFRKQYDVGGNNVVPGSLVVVRDSGTAAVAWEENASGAKRVRLAVASPNFKDAETVPDATNPSLALSPNGDIMLGYTQSGQGFAALRKEDTTLAAGTAVPGATSTPQVAAKAGGGWESLSFSSVGPVISGIDAGADGAFSGVPVKVSALVRPASGDPVLATNRSGEVVAAWQTSAPGIDGAVRPAGSDWQAATLIGNAPATGVDLHATMNSSGGAVVGWLADATNELGTAYRAPGGAFGAASVKTGVTDPFGPIGVAVDSAGGILTARVAGTEKGTVTASLEGGSDIKVSIAERGLAGPSVAMDEFGNGVVAWASAEAANPVSVAAYSRDAPKASAPALLADGLRLTLDEPARVTYTIARGRDDVAGEKVATLGAGESTIPFSKRVKKFVKRSGKYKVRIVTADAGPVTRATSLKLPRS